MDGMRTLAARLVRVRPTLRGMKLEMLDSDKMHVRIRVAGHTRWEIQRDARKLIILFLRRVFVAPSNLELELVTTERNGRELYLGEGRTPMGRRPRAAQKADGTPWDDYEWWGDELPKEDRPGHTPTEEAAPEVDPRMILWGPGGPQNSPPWMQQDPESDPDTS